ncbi:hypothetical protein D5R93_02245 [Actinomyces lilanjuaniae]|uniref:Uncharacterized protein n=1 Tax=Actinomyces lilanjuaniae TaxID=2321394 RepID=A0ABN5PLP3_9ACTO|nr:hypothetical protein [Actinomyces lilanjuaniae]AYD89168.1 hypothetical protein D5R93_02245 [Actinomyces lilanjuaniae]
MTAVHPYFTARAEAWMRHAGGDPRDAADLARWAQTARMVGDPARGVVVAADGTLVAETRRSRGLALGAIRQAVGQPVAHATYAEVCQGAGHHPGQPAAA